MAEKKEKRYVSDNAQLMTEWDWEKNNKLNYDFVNAHINNIGFPKTIEQLEDFIYEHGCYNVEDVINEAADGYTIWTVPRSSAVGDIVLYFHAKTAIQWIRKLETATKVLDPAMHDQKLLVEWLQRARELYSLYGGKIFAIGRIGSRPEKEDELMGKLKCNEKSELIPESKRIAILGAGLSGEISSEAEESEDMRIAREKEEQQAQAAGAMVNRMFEEEQTQVRLHDAISVRLHW